MIVFDNQKYLKKWAEKALDLPLPDDARCIGNELNGVLKAVVVYCNFQGKSCQTHICSVGSHWITKDFLWAMFDYPFEKLGLKVILGVISGVNKKSLKLSRKLGFEDIANIPDAHNDGDLVILTMRPHQCKWLHIDATLKKTLGVGDGRKL